MLVDPLGEVHLDRRFVAKFVAVHRQGAEDAVGLDGGGERFGSSGIVAKRQRPLTPVEPVQHGIRDTPTAASPTADGGPIVLAVCRAVCSVTNRTITAGQTVELPGIEPGSYGIPSRLLRAQFAMPLLGSPGHAN